MKSTFSNPFGVALESEGAGYIWAITAFQYRTLENPFGCEHTKDTMLKSEHSWLASSPQAPEHQFDCHSPELKLGLLLHRAIFDSSLRAENGHVVSLSLVTTCEHATRSVH